MGASYFQVMEATGDRHVSQLGIWARPPLQVRLVTHRGEVMPVPGCRDTFAW